MSIVISGSEAAADEPRCLCIVTDETDTDWRSSKITVNLPVSTSISGLYESVAKCAGYEFSSFLLAWLKINEQIEEEILLTPDSAKTLFELGLGEKRNKFVLKQRDGRDPVRIDVPDTTAYSGNNLSNKSVSWSSTGQLTDSSETDVKTGNFVGLVNQAMTCYLNSLLQTLYMTPEFRNALYKWRFDGGPDEEVLSIPYQLQKLFVNLQTTKSRAIETTDVTKSFGWDSDEAWQQHDVQELCRVMFDALEKKFCDTDQEDLIKQLYEGQMQDYVKCLECGRESARTDTYLDIPLVIKPFGSDTAFGSVEEALKAFVTPETLDGSNQYSCERCGKKCNAHKGLKFLTFPYLLTLQLKRFDFDYVTFNRIKLNDRVTFPQELNLNGFIEKGEEGSGVQPSEAQQPSQVMVDSRKENGEASGPSTNSAATPPGLDSTDSLGKDDREHALAEESVAPVPTGPYVYQLFSIMVHSGSAIGGHYYAYIRSFQDGKWYSFNDMSVSLIGDADIKRTYGSSQSGSTKYYSSMYSSSANAYMLMYRQVSASNVLPLSSDDLPDHLKRVVEAIVEQEEASRRQAEIDRSMCKIRLYHDHPKDGRVMKQLEVHKDVTLEEAVAVAHRLCGLDDSLPVEHCRLVKYDHSYELLECSYEGREGTPMGQLLGGVRHSYLYDLLLETRREDETFLQYKPNGCTIKVFEVDLANGVVRDPRTARVQLGWTVAQMKHTLQEKFSFPAATSRVLMDKYWGEPLLLANSAAVLKKLGFFRSNKIFVEPVGEPDCSYRDSRLWQVLDLYRHTIELTISLPTSSMQPAEKEGQANNRAAASDKTVSCGRTFCLKVDKRRSVAELKDMLKTDVGVDVKHFKLFRVSVSGQEFEVTNQMDSLSEAQLTSGTSVIVQLGRALGVDECRARLFLFKMNEINHLRPLPDVIHPVDLTISQLKVQVAKEINANTSHPDMPKLSPDRIRLRKKSWKGPGKVLRDCVSFADCIFPTVMRHTWEAVVQELDGEDRLEESETRHIVYVRRWQPSTYTLGPFEEMVLNDKTVESFKKDLAKLSAIPLKRLDFAKARGSYPCETSVLEVQDDLTWNPEVENLDQYPLYLIEDESVFFYRDSSEEVMVLTDEKRLEFQKKDMARTTRQTRVTFGSGPREKALKIYTDKNKPENGN